MNKQLVVPVSISIFVLFIVSMFIFGDMGVLSSFEKKRQIRQLKYEISLLDNIRVNKIKFADKLKKDKSLIRKLALMYGMKGGENIKYSGIMESFKKYPHNSVKINGTKPFLIRYPFLILLIFLAIMIFLFFLLLHKSKVKSKHRYVKNSIGRAIRPSWS